MFLYDPTPRHRRAQPSNGSEILLMLDVYINIVVIKSSNY